MINIKKKPVKIISLVLCGTLVCSGVGAGAYAAGVKKTESNAAVQTSKVKTTDEDTAKEAAKDETVYVIAGADGSVKKVIVSDWIKNTLESASLTDSTDLENITNVKGDESYTINSDNMKVWDAQGNDIYYTGDINKEIPVNMNISYQLDGKSVSADELAGKSGEVTIRFDYTNNQYEMVEIDGQQEKIYVPFAMITGMMLDNEEFSNVRVSNGKVINDGSHTIVAGLALPGLSDNLQIKSSEIEIPDYVEITADVKDFELTTTLTLATNEIFNEVDLGDSNSMEDLENSMNKLTDAMSQLLDGSSQLYNGLSTLLNKSDELVGYINQFAAASKDLSDGAAKADAGVASLQAYINQLSSGLSQLAGKNSELNGGGKEVFETLLKTATDQLTAQLADAGIQVPALTIDNYDAVLDNILYALDEENVYKQVQAGVRLEVEKNRDYIESQVISAVRPGVKEKVLAETRQQVLVTYLQNGNPSMTLEQYEQGVKDGTIPQATQDYLNNAVDQYMASLTEAQINAAVDAAMESDDVKKLIADNVEAQIVAAVNEHMNDAEPQAKLSAASEGFKKVSALKTSLDNYNKFYQGLLLYTSKVSEAAQGAAAIAGGAADLKAGTSQLAAGASEFYNKFSQFQSGAGALTDGVSQLKDGAMQLTDGLKQLNEEGIQKLVNAVDGDLGKLAARAKATLDVSRDYKSFAGISDEMDGSVRFIYKTDEIKKSDN